MKYNNQGKNNTNVNFQNPNLKEKNKKYYNSNYANVNNLNKANNNIVPIIENFGENSDTNENFPLEEHFKENDNQIYIENKNNQYHDSNDSNTNFLFNKNKFGVSSENKSEENVSEDGNALVDFSNKETNEMKFTESNMETLKPVNKEDKQIFNYYNNIKLYNEDLFEKTGKIKKSINPYESIYKIASQFKKENEKKPKKEKAKNNEKNGKNYIDNNNYCSSVSTNSKDVEYSGTSRTNNFKKNEINNNNIPSNNNIYSINTGKINNFYANFDKNKQFLSPQKLQETSPIFFKPGEMKFNSNSLANENEKRGNDLNILNEFKNIVFGNKPNNYNKPQIETFSTYNYPDNFQQGSITQKGFNSNLSNTNNYSTIKNNNNNSNNNKKLKTNEQNISKSQNFHSKKNPNNPVIKQGNNPNNRENGDQINDFLKNIIYQNNINLGMVTVKHASNNNLDHKRFNSLSNQNNLILPAEEKQTSNCLKKLQLPLIVKKEVGNKL